MRALLAAIGFLTRLPVPRGGATDFAGAVRFYPVAGLAVGAVVAVAGHAVAQGGGPWLGALAALLAWTWVTGALHLDGLADLADGIGAAHGDRARLLAVMADPHVGSFGVVAIVLQLAAKLVALAALLPQHWPALVAIPAVARIGPLVWARWLPPLRSGGLGAAIATATRTRDIAAWAVATGVAGIWLPPLAIGFVAVGALWLWLRVRIGGVTGDMHGAGVEIVESALLLAFAYAAS